MIQVRCLNCNKLLLEEYLIEGVSEKICDKCKKINRLERKGKDYLVKQTIVQSDIY